MLFMRKSARIRFCGRMITGTEGLRPTKEFSAGVRCEGIENMNNFGDVTLEGFAGRVGPGCKSSYRFAVILYDSASMFSFTPGPPVG